jgi:hypothetical protein
MQSDSTLLFLGSQTFNSQPYYMIASAVEYNYRTLKPGNLQPYRNPLFRIVHHATAACGLPCTFIFRFSGSGFPGCCCLVCRLSCYLLSAVIYQLGQVQHDVLFFRVGRIFAEGRLRVETLINDFQNDYFEWEFVLRRIRCVVTSSIRVRRTCKRKNDKFTCIFDRLTNVILGCSSPHCHWRLGRWHLLFFQRRYSREPHCIC